MEWVPAPLQSAPTPELGTSTPPLPPQVLIILAENLETDTDRGWGFIAINRGRCTVNIGLKDFQLEIIVLLLPRAAEGTGWNDGGEVVCETGGARINNYLK